MSISALSIRRKIAVTCIIIMFVFLGYKSYKTIGLDLLPKFDLPYAQIATVYVGASPEEVEVDIARRIEEAISSIDGVKHITNMCMENACSTMIEFQLGIDVDIVIHEIREKINTVIDDFPSGAETPTLTKINTNAISVVTLYLTGEQTIDDMYDYVDDQLSDYFSSIPGVAQIRIHGGNEVQLHVLLNPEKLTASNLTIPEIIAAIKNNNVKIPAGRLKENGTEIDVTFNGEFQDIESLKQLEISNHQNRHVYLGDVAEIKLIAREIRQEAYLNDQMGIGIEIVKKSEANAVQVIENVKKKYNQLLQYNMLPSGMKIHWFTDSGEFILASIEDAWASVLIGIALTALLLFLFLHDIRTTIICSITMPIAIVITFIFFKGMGYTFNMMTLVSLGCSTGVLVDNSIVIIESIFTLLNKGVDRIKAAADGTTAVINAIIASAMTNIVVFVPIMTMGAQIGMVLTSFAGVMVIATAVAIVVSLTLTPILAALILRSDTKRGKMNVALFFLWDKYYDTTVRIFNWSIVKVSRHSGIVIIAIIGLCVVLMQYTLPKIKMGFMPQNDRSELAVSLEFPANSTLQVTRERTMDILHDLKKNFSYILDTSTTIGYKNALSGQVSKGLYLAQISVNLKPKDQRKSLPEILEELRAYLREKLDNVLYNIVIPSPIGSADVEFTAYITGTELEQLNYYARLGADILRESGTSSDVDVSCREGKPRITLYPERPILKNLGITASTLGSTIIGNFDGIQAGSYKVGLRSYDIRIKTQEQEGFNKLDKITAGSLNGNPINLDTLVTRENNNVSISVIRQDKERSSWIYANPNKTSSIGQMMNVLREKLVPQLEPGYRLHFFGQSEMMEEGVNEFQDVFLTAIILTFLMIAAVMESWSRPFLVMFTIPLGFVGMFAATVMSGSILSLIGLLGGVMMIGLVVNNAILIMDECSVLIHQGKPTHQAMIEATQNKLRPVLMTSISSIVGMLPMAFGTGLGSELRSSCGIAVVGGLTLSSFLTLYLIPALYFKFVPNTAYPKQGIWRGLLHFFGIPVAYKK